MKSPTQYLSITKVLFVHDRAVKEFGGSFGIRDIGLVESAVARPQASFDGNDLYQSIYDKTAALLQSLLKNHPFVDGNKRTAWVSAVALLKMKGWQIIAKEDEVVEFMVRVANENLSVDEIAGWVKKNCKKL